MILENSSALWLLLVLPFLLLGSGLWGWRAKNEIAGMFQLSPLRLKRSHVEKYVISGILMTLLIGALASPKLPLSTLATPKKSGEIALLVDNSGSMAAKKDVNSPNRLERVKPILYEIIDRMEDRRAVKISLHGITSIARSLVPFVGQEDYPYLEESIKRVLDINSTPGQGSSLGRSILSVAEKFSRGEKAKIIILFSDGETYAYVSVMAEVEKIFIEAAAAIREAKREGIKVITVGIGEREGAKIPLYDTYGEFTGEYTKRHGVDYISYLREEGLKEIASQTGGKYFFEENREGLIEFIEENLTSATTGEVTEEVKDYQSVAYWFVLGSLPIWVVFARRHLLA